MRFRLYRVAFLVLITVFLCITSSYADGGVLTASGGLISTKDATEVVLDRESIDFSFYSDKSFHSYCKVTCNYQFINTSSQPASVKVGFPISVGWPSRVPSDRELESFQVLVDGNAVEPRREEVTEKIYSDYPKFHYSHYYTWTMNFNAGEKKKMVNSYVQRLGGGEGAVNFGYVLSTGAGWKGAIRELEITARFPQSSVISFRYPETARFRGFTNSFLDTHHIISIEGPPTPILEKNRLTWKLRDIEPKEEDNISVYISTSGVQTYDDSNRITYMTTVPWQFVPVLRWFGVSFPEAPADGRVLSLKYGNEIKSRERSYTFHPSARKGWQYFRFYPGPMENNFRRGGTEGCTDLFLGTDVITATSILCERSTEHPEKKRVNRFSVFSPYLLADGRKETAWVEGVPGDGVGECIRVAFPCAFEVKALSITNGYCKSRDTFVRNNRVKRLELSGDFGRETVSVQDVMEPQKIDLRGGKTRFVELRIVEIYKGSHHRDTAISELDVL